MPYGGLLIVLSVQPQVLEIVRSNILSSIKFYQGKKIL